MENEYLHSSKPLKLYGGVEADIEEEAVLDVEEMTCGICEISLQEELSKCDGVINSIANHKDWNVWVGVQGKMKVDKLIKEVEKAGFSAYIS